MSRSRRRAALATAVAVAVAVTVPVHADDAETAADLVVRVGTLRVGDGAVLHDAVIVVRDGRFASVTEGGKTPQGVPLRTFADAVACPGFVDPVTQLGLDGGAVESPEALTPDVRAADAFDPRHRDLLRAVRGGITTIGLVPAAGNVSCGRAAVARIAADGRGNVLPARAPQTFAFISPALGTNRVPATLAGARRMLAEAFAGRPWRTPGESDPPVRQDALQTLAALRDEPVFAWVDDAQSAGVAAEVLRARGLEPVLLGLRRGGGEAREISRLVVPCVVTGLSLEDDLRLLDLPGELEGDVLISGGGSPRALRMALSLAVARGLAPERALEAVTSRPARALGAAGAVGRVAKGLHADLVVWSGEPWELTSRPLLVLSGGRVAREAAGR